MVARSDPYDLLKSIVHISNSSVPIGTKLEEMLQEVSEAFASDQCLLLKPEKIGGNGFLSQVALERKPLWVDEESPFKKESLLPEEKVLLRPSFACIPLYDEKLLQGILYICFCNGRRFSAQEIDLLLLIAKEIEGTIQNTNLHGKIKQTLSKLAALQGMGKALTSTLRIEELFKLMIATGLKTLKAKSGILRLENRKTGELEVRSTLGNVPLNPFDEKIARRVYYTRTPLSLHHFNEENPSLSILCVPFLSKGKSFGTLTFCNKKADPPKFDESDFQLLLIMVNQMSCAIENALIHYETLEMAKNHEKNLKQLSTLWELNKALLTTVNFERITHMTLTAITIGDGLGFNRAMLFMVNEKNGLLEGTLAVGPDSAEEAGKIWSTLSQKKGNLSDLVTQIKASPKIHSMLNDIVKGIRIPLDQEQCILSKTILEGRPFNIRFPQSEEGWLQTPCEHGCSLGSEVGCYVSDHLGRNPRTYSFATVPLWGKGGVIGVILVDNIYNQNPIADDDLYLLNMFSNQAGLAVENAILYKNLEELHQELKETQNFLVHQEKMVALGELCNTIVHEIKNPLVSIGGFARRLYRTIPDEAPERRATQTIMIEVGRVEKILNDLYHYTRDESILFKEYDLRSIIEDSISMVSEKFDGGDIKIVKEFAEDLPKVKGNYHQLKQSFFNLIANAYQVMKDKGTLSVRIYSFSNNGSSLIRVEVEDTGRGIDPKNLHNIFNPFYSTKESVLGLGLPIVHKIVTSHQGQIEVDNRPGEGVNFIITLPTVEEKGRK